MKYHKMIIYTILLYIGLYQWICQFTFTITNNPDGEFINGRFHCYGGGRHYGKFVTCDTVFGNEYSITNICRGY